MRLFIAIELPKEIKEHLADIQDRLKACGADVKWVEPKNIHLTLKFLGEVNDKKIERITDALRESAKANKPFTMSLSGLGAFPGPDSPRIIWVGVDEGKAQAKKLALDLEERIARIGIPKEKRPFSSHITIARVRSGLNRDKLAWLLREICEEESGRTDPGFEVEKIILFKSTLKPQGPIYEPLQEAMLEG